MYAVEFQHRYNIYFSGFFRSGFQWSALRFPLRRFGVQKYFLECTPIRVPNNLELIPLRTNTYVLLVKNRKQISVDYFHQYLRNTRQINFGKLKNGNLLQISIYLLFFINVDELHSYFSNGKIGLESGKSSCNVLSRVKKVCNETWIVQF